MKEILDAKSVDENDYIRAMALKMKKKFDKYWGECNLLMAIGAVLDPRCKMMVIEFCFPEIYHTEAEANKNIDMVREDLYELYYEYVSVHTSVNSEGSSQLKTRETCSSSTLSNEKFIVTGRSKFESFVRKANTIQPMKSDLDIYLEESVYICNEVASESTFSAGGRVIDPYRASLSTETVQMLLCGADWVRAFYGIKKGSEAEETSFKEIWLP
ncbi:hypothetical protein Acr_24g0017670 [Actinidia rufa]|uniref:Uncharacterized protein n=1 Tax=Actinidia rufa TaxID=165716 RepID=A0A7J0GXL5_9ERIC|nr:hypothetical protein Acr_24g0017670 [Actinidia rufa]